MYVKNISKYSFPFSKKKRLSSMLSRQISGSAWDIKAKTAAEKKFNEARMKIIFYYSLPIVTTNPKPKPKTPPLEKKTTLTHKCLQKNTGTWARVEKKKSSH